MAFAEEWMKLEILILERQTLHVFSHMWIFDFNFYVQMCVYLCVCVPVFYGSRIPPYAWAVY